MIRSRDVEMILSELATATDLQHDSRFRFWAKRIDGVDTSQTNGYMFTGDFVRGGTVDVSGPGLYLVHSVNGSRKYATEHYTVVRMDADGTLHTTDVGTTGRESGWAVRIRDDVVASLAEMSGQTVSPLAAFTDAKVMDEARRRGLVS